VIRGQVTPDREANFFLTIEGPAGQREQMEVTVDTGFNGFLTIPPAVVTRLALPIRAPTQATLADGTMVHADPQSTPAFAIHLTTSHCRSTTHSTVCSSTRHAPGFAAAMPAAAADVSRTVTCIGSDGL